jgi:hypothetical protein
MSKVKVKSIQIAFPDGFVKEMSIEDAKELFKQLEELFGSVPVIIPSVPVIIEREVWPRWVGPYVTERPTYYDNTPQVWCISDEGGTA